MDNQTITLTLPFNAQQFWVFTIALSLMALSGGIALFSGKRVEKDRLPKDWLRNSLLIAGGLLAPIWAALLFMVLTGLWHLAWDMPKAISAGNASLRWHTLAIVGLITTFVGILGAPLAMIRVVMAERQTRATEEGLVTDRINKAVEGLGAVREVKEGEDITTKPNLEMRLGAVLSLDRIADDSPRDQKAILCILASYTIANAQLASQEAKSISGNTPLRSDLRYAINSASKIASSVRTTHLSMADRLLDLRQVEIECTDITRVNFENALMHVAKFNKSSLSECTFTHCILKFSSFENSFIIGSKFIDTYMRGVDFSNISWLEQNEFHGCAFRELTLPKKVATLETIERSFGDGSVKLASGISPDHPEWPSHWPTQKLSDEDFMAQWRAWQRTIGFQPDENQQ